MANLQKSYKDKISKELKQAFKYKSVMEVPRLKHITVNMGVGEAANDKKIMEKVLYELGAITGQKAVTTMARKSVASFKIREGWPIGCKVTLRGKKMYEFLERLVSIAIPRIRDFRGISVKSFDGRGNYNLGIKEQNIFPEIDFDKIDAIRGMDIAIITSAKSDKEACALLSAFGFPFKDKDKLLDEA